jgi:hypothetical protein
LVAVIDDPSLPNLAGPGLPCAPAHRHGIYPSFANMFEHLLAYEAMAMQHWRDMVRIS